MTHREINAVIKVRICSLITILLNVFRYMSSIQMGATGYIVTFELPFMTDYTQSSISLPRNCTTPWCQRNRNEIYWVSTLHVWYYWYIWLHCWSRIHWMVGFSVLILIIYYILGSSFIILQIFIFKLSVYLFCTWEVVILPPSNILSSFLSFFSYRTRYFSQPRKGHNPLQGRAYYQLLECLGVFLLIIINFHIKCI